MSYFMYSKILMIMLTFSVSYSSYTQSELAQPTQQEFLNALENIEINTFNSFKLVDLAETEWMYRYGASATFQELSTGFDNFKHYTHFIPGGPGAVGPVANYNLWMELMLERWLSETRTQLQDDMSLTFDEFTLVVNIDDFDSDDELEVFLEVTHGVDPVNYHNYMTAVPTLTGYDIEPAPISFFSKRFTGDGAHRSQKGILEKTDYNRDGNIDWLFGYFPAITGRDGTSEMMPNNSVAAVYWHDDHLKRLFHVDDIGVLKNIDGDDALEIVSNAGSRFDNWNCGYSAYNVTDWDGQQYVRLPTQYKATDCTAHDAEVAMMNGDFENAIKLYNKYLLYNAENYDRETNCQQSCYYRSQNELIFEYFYVRRILAHALLGHQDAVAEQLSNIPYQLKTFQTNDANGFQVASGLASMMWQSAATDPEELCYIAYENAEYLEDPYTGFFVGRVFEPNAYQTDVLRAIHSDDFAYKAGCDIRYFTDDFIPESTEYLKLTIPEPREHLPSQAESQLYVERLFLDMDYNTVLQVAQNAETVDFIETAHWLYWEALAYEALGQTTIANDIYQNIVNDYSETPYAIMAGLHYGID